MGERGTLHLSSRKMKIAGLYFSFLFFGLALESNSLKHGDVCQTHEKTSGRCIGIGDCPYFSTQITKKPFNMTLIDVLRKSLCGPRNEKPLICCPSGGNTFLVPNKASSGIQHSSTTDAKFTNRGSCLTPSGQYGACISIQACPLLTDLLKDPSTIATNLEVLLKHRCEQSKADKSYCCPALANKVSCGLTKDAKFPKGEGNSTELFQFPWMALLAYNSSRGIKYNCYGSIINSRYILTGATCVGKFKKPIHVVLGEYNLNKEIDCKDNICAPPPQTIPIEKIIVHPSSTGKGNYFADIALIRLSREADFSSYAVRPICLDIIGDLSDDNYEGRRFVTSSWKVFGKESRTLNVPVKNFVRGVSHEQCSNLYQNITKIVPSQVCAKAENGNECASVSGSPLVSYETIKDKTVAVQYGIALFGTAKCEPETNPLVYTKVNSFKDWILETLYPESAKTNYYGKHEKLKFP